MHSINDAIIWISATTTRLSEELCLKPIAKHRGQDGVVSVATTGNGMIQRHSITKEVDEAIRDVR